MKEAHKHRITGFYSAHLQHTPEEKKGHRFQRPYSAKWRDAKALAHKRGIEEVWYPSDSIPGSGSKPIFKRAVDPAEILGQVRLLVDAELSAGDRQLLAMFINRCNFMGQWKIALSHNIISQIREVAGLISAGDYDPETRPPAHKKNKRSEAAVAGRNYFVQTAAKKRIDIALHGEGK